jgi:hypothetical protein
MSAMEEEHLLFATLVKSSNGDSVEHAAAIVDVLVGVLHHVVVDGLGKHPQPNSITSSLL